MKRIYFISVIISIGLGVLFPWAVYKVFGFFWNYAPVKEKYVDMAAIILLLTLFLIMLIIGLSKHGRQNINLAETVNTTIFSNNAVEHLYLLSIAINLINVIQIGDFTSLIGGAGNGAIIAYLQLFLDMRILYFLVLMKAYKKQRIGKILFYSILYVGISILYASRSGLFWMVFFNVCLVIGVKIPKALKQKIVVFLVVGVMLSPFVFSISTIARGGAENTVEYMAKQIVVRLSYIEISGIELEQYEEKTYEEQVFREKYGMKNQIAQAINSLLPGDIFEWDVQPNQYWRTIFAGWTIEGAKEHYTSMNMILPLYLFLKYDGVFGIVLCIVICYALFRLICKIKDMALASFFACYLFYTFFQYFDWAYHIRDLTCFALTILAIRLYENILRKVRIGRYRFYERNESVGCNTSV